jgi:hypothetical protein
MIRPGGQAMSHPWSSVIARPASQAAEADRWETRPLSRESLDGVQYTVSRHSASPRESAEFPTTVKEVVAMVVPPQPYSWPALSVGRFH